MFNKEVKFFNYTDEDFVCRFNNNDYTFKAKTKYNIPQDIAEFFARKLAVKVLFSQGKDALLEADMKAEIEKALLGVNIEENKPMVFEVSEGEAEGDDEEEEEEVAPAPKKAVAPARKRAPKKAEDEDNEPLE